MTKSIFTPFTRTDAGRRRFLIGTGLCLSLPSLSAWSRSLAPTSVAAAPSFRLSAPTAQTLAPFALAHAFRRGEIPAGSAILSDLPNFQATIRNRWPDGSAKIAMLCGRATLSANQPLQVNLHAGTASAGTALTEADLLATGIQASIDFSGQGLVQLAPLIGQASSYDSVARRWTAGRVRECYSGAQGSSWLYYAPIGTDPLLSAWFEVRLWAGGAVEVVPWIENGYLLTSGGGERSGTVTFRLAGQIRFTQALTVIHHTRTVLASGSQFAHWLGTDPGVRTQHDCSYLQSTRLVPAYLAQPAANSPLFNRLVGTYTPFGLANHAPGMGQTGYHGSIGVLPEWDAAYLCSNADPRALAAVQVNALSAGRYGVHYRDETRNAALLFSANPSLCMVTGNSGISGVGSSTTNTYVATATGASPPGWSSSHHPSLGYLAYLVTGRWYYLEQMQFNATLNFLKQDNLRRGNSAGVFRTNSGSNTTRGAAWALRTLSQAACITPDADTALRADLVASLNANVNYYHQTYIAQANHPDGVCAPYSDYSAGDGVYTHATWMEDFLTAAFGYLIDLALISSGTPTTQLQAFYQWKVRSVVGRLGVQGDPNAYNYRDAGLYNIAVAPSDTANWDTGAGPWYANWGQAYTATIGTPNTPSPDTSLRGGNFPDGGSYWANMQPAIAYAVTHGMPGARAAYQRLLDASNWSQLANAFNDMPVWAVKPHEPADLIFANGFNGT